MIKYAAAYFILYNSYHLNLQKNKCIYGIRNHPWSWKSDKKRLYIHTHMMNDYPREKQLSEYFMGQTFTVGEKEEFSCFFKKSSYKDRLITLSSLQCAFYRSIKISHTQFLLFFSFPESPSTWAFKLKQIEMTASLWPNIKSKQVFINLLALGSASDFHKMTH